MSSSLHEECIDDFEIIRIIGRGSFGKVYKAISKKSDRPCAIKVIDKKVISERGLEKRVANEIEIHSRLRHPSVVSMKSFFEDDKCVYMILEYCRGGTLKQFLKK